MPSDWPVGADLTADLRKIRSQHVGNGQRGYNFFGQFGTTP